MQAGLHEQTSGDGRTQFREGKVARTIERATARMPSDIFLWGALAAMGLSLAAQLTGASRGMMDWRKPARAPLASFLGMWAPTLLLFGVYNKIVKVAGSDRTS
jgi:hypothetical protein